MNILFGYIVSMFAALVLALKLVTSNKEENEDED